MDSVLDHATASRTLQVVFVAAALACALIALSAYLDSQARLGLLATSAAGAFVLLTLVTRMGRVQLAAPLGIGLIIVIALWRAADGHGIRSLFIPALGFVIILATLVLRRAHAIAVAILTSLSVITLAGLEYAGLLSTTFQPHTSLSTLAGIVGVFLAISLTAHRLATSFHDGLRQARLKELSYQDIFNATTEAIFLVDPTTERIIDVNQSAQMMLGYSRPELLRSTLQQLAQRHQARKQVVDMMEAGLQGRPLLFEWVVTSKDGTEKTAEVSLRPSRVGSTKVLLAVMRDATEQRQLQAKLQESEKLRAVGQLAGGIAHDFNNQLTGILANATLLTEKLEDERLRKAAEVIVRCSRRSADLTAQLLAFARKGKHQNVDVNLEEMIREVVDLLKHTIDKRISLRMEFSAEVLSVRGDPTLLQNALLNLGLNARDAMPKGGTLTFRTSRHLVESTQTGISQPTLRHGEYAKLEVTDTGLGISPENLKHVFEPFFTTKETGNGMGLAAVYGAVESHRGDVTVMSTVGQGTTFTLLLPLSDVKKESTHLKVSAARPNFSGVRILFAEDERDVARATKALLKELGCTVTHVEDGTQALSRFKGSPDAFDLVLLDHMMPGMSGREALDKMRSLRPDLRAILTSGYATDTVIETERDDPPVFLPKPFGLKQLERSLERALEGTSDLTSSPESEIPFR